MNKTKTIKIIVTRAEGPSDLCYTREFDTYKSANAWIALNSLTAPKTGGYDKHDVTIHFEDGETYKARLDVYHPSKEKNETIEQHIIHHCRFYGGLLTEKELPKHLTSQEYRKFLVRHDANDFIKFLQTYKLDD